MTQIKDGMAQEGGAPTAPEEEREIPYALAYAHARPEGREDIAAAEDPDRVTEAARDEDIEPEVYKTQREIDAAMGRRLRRERERWEKRHGRALMLEQALGDAGMEEAVAQALASRMRLDAQDVLAAMMDAASPEDLRREAQNAALLRQACAMRERNPEFDLSAAMQNGALRALVEAGEPLEKAYAYVNLEQTLQRERDGAQQELMRSIAARGMRPAPLHGRGGFAGADFANMPEEALRSIDERLRRGEKVRV